MGRRSVEATNARLICPSLRAVCGDCAAFFFCAFLVAAAECFFCVVVWARRPDWNTRRDKREINKKRLNGTEFNYLLKLTIGNYVPDNSFIGYLGIRRP